MLTVQDVERALPTHLKVTVNQSLVDMINNVTSDPLIAETIRNNFLSYSTVLKEGRFKMEDYINAVAYVSYKAMGHSNRDAYALTFPARYQALAARNVSEKDISAYVSAYAKGKLVTLVLEQSVIPLYLLNMDARQKAVNTLVDLMLNSQSDKVRSDSAAHLLTHLKEPETKKIQLDIGVADSSGLKELNDTLHKLATLQQDAIRSGVSTKEIAHQTIIDAEVIPNNE